MMPRWDKYIGIPFVDNGRIVESDGGLDCWGLVRVAYQEQLDIELPMLPNAINTVDVSDREKLIVDTAGAVWMEMSDVKEANLMLCHLANRTHVGIYIGSNRILNTKENVGSCIEKLDTPRWRSRRFRYFEYVG